MASVFGFDRTAEGWLLLTSFKNGLAFLLYGLTLIQHEPSIVLGIVKFNTPG